jgi:hypothetical protein
MRGPRGRGGFQGRLPVASRCEHRQHESHTQRELRVMVSPSSLLSGWPARGRLKPQRWTAERPQAERPASRTDTPAAAVSEELRKAQRAARVRSRQVCLASTHAHSGV